MTHPTPPPDARDHANRTLDRAIAERLGWRSEQYVAKREMHNPQDVGKTYWRLFRDGKIVDWYRDSEWEVWKHGELPHYSTDANAALSLVDAAQPAYFTLSYSPDRMNWRAEFAFGYRKDIFADAREPAEAVCRAWLEWRETFASAPRAADADGRRSGNE